MTYRAVTSTVPSATPVSSPAVEIVAIPVEDDCHVACVVTSRVEPLLWSAVAESCRVSPGASVVEAFPATLMVTDVAVTAGAVGVLEPHPAAATR